MFQLAPEELGNLRFQVGISSSAHGGRRKPVSAFTEQGVAMLSGVSRSQRAVQVNIAITRAFVRLRETLSVQKELAHKLVDLERTIENHDESIHTLLGAIRQLMPPPEPAAQGNRVSHQRRRRALPHQTKGCPPVKAEEMYDILRQLEGARALSPEWARDRAGWMVDQPVSGFSQSVRAASRCRAQWACPPPEMAT